LGVFRGKPGLPFSVSKIDFRALSGFAEPKGQWIRTWIYRSPRALAFSAFAVTENSGPRFFTFNPKGLRWESRPQFGRQKTAGEDSCPLRRRNAKLLLEKATRQTGDGKTFFQRDLHWQKVEKSQRRPRGCCVQRNPTHDRLPGGFARRTKSIPNAKIKPAPARFHRMGSKSKRFGRLETPWRWGRRAAFPSTVDR